NTPPPQQDTTPETKAQAQTQAQPEAQTQAQAQPEAQPQAQAQGYGRELTNLAKLYADDNKYSGEDDNFDFKLTIFHDNCSRADVPEEAKVRAYPTMLRGLALDHYYTNLKDIARTMPLSQICDTDRKSTRLHSSHT